jgi:maleylpyruvate isomerase
LRALQAATQSLLLTTRRLTELDVRRPSLLPGWSRAHVLSHLAGNAEGGTRLLEGVVSGMPGWEYRDLASRATDIETGSHDPVAVLVARVEATAQRFDDACVRVLPEQWATPVTWTTGHQNAAREVVTSRLFEVEIHHVDLATGRTLDDWPNDLVATVFDVVVEALKSRADFPPMTLQLDDHPDSRTLGESSSPLVVAGSRADVLTWLLGRSDGHTLRVSGGHRVPSLPDLY